MRYKFKKWEDDSTNPKRTVNILKDMTLIAYYEVVGMVEHVWKKPLTITESKLTCEITITGTPEVDNEQTISVSISNNRTADVSGSVKAEVLKDSEVKDTLQPPLDITILAGKSWSKSYTWVPDVSGDYVIRVTFTEA